ncbi:MAG: hypothetical protein J6B72_02800 [Clostridia bacterium]|nr:hypothetical protein [Clostridia bacterium]
MKRISLLLLILALVVGCFSVSASAASVDQDTPSAQVGVYYTLRGQYCISIPSSIFLSQGDTITFSADYVHLVEGESVTVKLADSTFDADGSFKLSQIDGNGTMACTLTASNTANAEGTVITKDNAATAPIITYTADNATDKGYLQITPQIEPTTAAGPYSGFLMFDISLLVAENTEG